MYTSLFQGQRPRVKCHDTFSKPYKCTSCKDHYTKLAPFCKHGLEQWAGPGGFNTLKSAVLMGPSLSSVQAHQGNVGWNACNTHQKETWPFFKFPVDVIGWLSPDKINKNKPQWAWCDNVVVVFLKATIEQRMANIVWTVWIIIWWHRRIVRHDATQNEREFLKHKHT